MEQLPEGFSIDVRDGRVYRMVDCCGNLAVDAQWNGERLERASFRLPDGSRALLVTDVVTEPLFGRCDGVYREGTDEPLALLQSVDWSDPTWIPPVDRPGALPPGAGAAILNFLSRQALLAGRDPIRYRGPYSTGALFDSLYHSFTVVGDRREAFEQFTSNVERTSVQADMWEAPVDFTCRPFVWWWQSERVCVQLRDGVERVYIDGRAYSRDVAGERRLRMQGDEVVAHVELAGEVWTDRAGFDSAGKLLWGPSQLPSVGDFESPKPIPDSVRDALGRGLVPRAPALLQAAVEAVLQRVPLRWGDARDSAAMFDGEAIVVHEVLGQQLAGRPPMEVMDLLARAIEPVAHSVAQAALARAHERASMQGDSE